MGLASQIAYLPGRLRGVFYGWWPVPAASFVTVLTSAPLSQAMTVWAVAIRGEHFGRASFGKILDVSTVSMNILMLFSAPFAGYIRDVRGTYAITFLAMGVVNFLGGTLCGTTSTSRWPTLRDISSARRRRFADRREGRGFPSASPGYYGL